MCIPQGLSIMNYQELVELIIQTDFFTGNVQGRRFGPSCVFLDYFVKHSLLKEIHKIIQFDM